MNKLCVGLMVGVLATAGAAAETSTVENIERTLKEQTEALRGVLRRDNSPARAAFEAQLEQIKRDSGDSFDDRLRTWNETVSASVFSSAFDEKGRIESGLWVLQKEEDRLHPPPILREKGSLLPELQRFYDVNPERLAYRNAKTRYDALILMKDYLDALPAEVPTAVSASTPTSSPIRGPATPKKGRPRSPHP